MWPKQKDAYLKVKRRGKKGTCIFAEMGTGKSRILIRFLEFLFNFCNVRLVLITAPKTPMYVWVQQWDLWAKLPVLFIDLHKTKSKGLDLAVKMARDGYPVICLVNYELARLIGKKRVKRKRNKRLVSTLVNTGQTKIDDVAWDVVALDESTEIKTPGSKTSMYFRRRVRPKAPYRFVLSGSAYTKRPLDAWAQVKFATGDEVFPGGVDEFKLKYTIPHPYLPGKILGYQNMEDFAAKLSQVAILLTKKDVLDIEDPVHQNHPIELTNKTRRFYDKVTEELYASLEEFERGGGEVTAGHILSVMNKQAQITGGFIYPDSPTGDPKDRPKTVRIGYEKEEELVRILKERDSPTIIGVQYNYEEKIVVDALKKHFNFVPKVLNSSIKDPADRHDLIHDARKDFAFVVKERVACKGSDMRWSDLILFYSHRPDTEEYVQFLSRNHRGGQKNLISYKHLTCLDTVDERYMSILNGDIALALEIEQNWRALL